VKGLPVPNQRDTDIAHLFPFTANAAVGYRPHTSGLVETLGSEQSAPGSPEQLTRNFPDQVRAIAFIDEALEAAHAISDVSERLQIVTRAAKFLAVVDRGRAIRLAADIERIVMLDTDRAVEPSRQDRFGPIMRAANKNPKDSNLHSLAKALVDIDCASAERVARSIPGVPVRAAALEDIAVAVAGTDADRAIALAESISDNPDETTSGPGSPRERALWHVAAVLASTDPDHAERVARSIPGVPVRAAALEDIAVAVAGTDADRAIALAESISDDPDETTSGPGSPRERALWHVAAVLASTDPDHAERLAESIPSLLRRHSNLRFRILRAANNLDDLDDVIETARTRSELAEAFGEDSTKYRESANVAEVLSGIGPNRAEYLAKSILSRIAPASELKDIAALADTNPDEAIRHASAIGNIEIRYRVLDHLTIMFAGIDPDHSERLAKSIDSPSHRSRMLSSAVNMLVASDPRRAERLARSIRREETKAISLARVAEKVASVDPRRAARLLVEAGQAVSGGGDPRNQNPRSMRNIAVALSAVAKLLASMRSESDAYVSKHFPRDVSEILELAATDPERAEAAIRAIVDEYDRISALRGLAEAVTATEPDWRARLTADAERIESQLDLAGLSKEDEAAHFFAKAEQLAMSISISSFRDSALQGIAEHILVSDPEQAERLAAAITKDSSRISSLGNIAEQLAIVDLDHAIRVANVINFKYDKVSEFCRIAHLLAGTAPMRAARLLGEAECAARSINKNKLIRAQALLNVAECWMPAGTSVRRTATTDE
jgi:hypothetical protein